MVSTIEPFARESCDTFDTVCREKFVETAAAKGGKAPNCKRIVEPPKRCAQGFTGTPPNCKPIVRPCPKGMSGRFPNCCKDSGHAPRAQGGQTWWNRLRWSVHFLALVRASAEFAVCKLERSVDAGDPVVRRRHVRAHQLHGT